MSPRPVNVSYDFGGRVVLITGAARGQGRAHARAFAAAGAKVAIADIGRANQPTIPYDLGTTDEINAVAEEILAAGGNCLPAVCDVRDQVQVNAFIDDVMQEYGQIDVLVNNSGVNSIYELADMPEEAWDMMLDTHLKGAFQMCKHVIPHMIAAGRGGRIITTGSVNSFVATPKQAHYIVAKHGLAGLTKALAVDLAPYGITVNLVCPGGIDTPMVAGMLASKDGEWMHTLEGLTGPWNLLDRESMLDPEEITHAVQWLASEAAAFVTGTSLLVDAGFTVK